MTTKNEYQTTTGRTRPLPASPAYVYDVTAWASTEKVALTCLGGNAVLFERSPRMAIRYPQASHAFVLDVTEDAEVTINGRQTDDYDITILALADYVTQHPASYEHVGRRTLISAADLPAAYLAQYAELQGN